MEATITIRLSEEDKKIFKSLADGKGMTLSDWVRESLIASIEDEYDLAIIADYERDKEAGKLELITHEELVKDLGLKDV